MRETVFFRVLAAEDKAAALHDAVSAVRLGTPPGDLVFTVDPAAFEQVPGSPFAYWVSDRIRRLFRELPPFEGDGRTVKQGLATADDFRFVRAWWEVAPERVVTGTPETTPEEFRAQTYAGKRWVPFAKGGEFSPYYSDLHLVIDWENDGTNLKAFPASVIRNPDYYFRPGLTYTNSTTSNFSIRCLPVGVIFSHMGQSCFISNARHRRGYLCIMNSDLFRFLLDVQVALADAGRRHYEVGLVRRTPVPELIGDVSWERWMHPCLMQKMEQDTSIENSHLFRLPGILRVPGANLKERLTRWERYMAELEAEAIASQVEIDKIVCCLYAIEPQHYPKSHETVAQSAEVERLSDEDGVGEVIVDRDDDGRQLIFGLFSYSLGSVFGRWDVRMTGGAQPVPQLPDPFAPLPVCSPGMLVGPEGLPARAEDVPADYPIPIQWDGIIPDDEGHPRDLITQVRGVLAYLFRDADPASIENEACQILETKDLRAWFAAKFFPWHIRRYTRSRRKAPIYWQLRSARKSYSLWLYYPRITRDTFWTALNRYVDPKIEHEERVLAELREKLTAARADGSAREERSWVRQAEAQQKLLEELVQFRSDIHDVANVGYEPDMDDGVPINIAPLYKLVPWKEAEVVWKDLLAGKYPWSTMAQRLQAQRDTTRRRA